MHSTNVACSINVLAWTSVTAMSNVVTNDDGISAISGVSVVLKFDATAEEILSNEIAERGDLDRLTVREMRDIVGGWAEAVNKAGLRLKAAEVSEAFIDAGIDTLGDLRIVDVEDAVAAGMKRAEGRRFAAFMRTTDKAKPNFTDSAAGDKSEHSSSLGSGTHP